MSHNPELAGYEPHDSSRSRRRSRVMRTVVWVSVVALVLPGVIIGATTAAATANRVCSVIVAHTAPQAIGYEVRFELFGPAPVGWNCYTVDFGGDAKLVTGLGIIPGPPVAP
jgi:hypothetical protein